jgi:hypothetical protein
MSAKNTKTDVKEILSLNVTNKPSFDTLFGLKSADKLKQKSKHIFNVIQNNTAKNKLESKHLSLDFFNKFQHISSGFYFYLMFRALVDLIIKHLMYIFEEGSYSYEYLILIVLSIVQLFFPICLIYTNFLANSKRVQLIREKISFSFLSLQLALFIVKGSIQFAHNMTYWDHLIRLNDQFPIELSKFLMEVLGTLFFFSIYGYVFLKNKFSK